MANLSSFAKSEDSLLRAPLPVTAFCAWMLAAAACGSRASAPPADTDSACTAGTVLCACLANSTCNPELTCGSGICVALGGTEAGTDSAHDTAGDTTLVTDSPSTTDASIGDTMESGAVDSADAFTATSDAPTPIDAPNGVCPAGTFVSDGGCQPCPANTFSSAPNAVACTPWTVCTAGQFITNYGSSTFDQICHACAAGTFTATSNQTTCTAWTSCPAGTFVSTAGSASGNQVCTACGTGTCSQSANASTCTEWTACTAGQYVSVAGTATTNQDCSACASGTFSATTNATGCTPWASCVAGQYVSTVGSASGNQVCTACPVGSYSISANAAACTTDATCPVGSYVSVAGTVTSDRQCAVCATGTTSYTTNSESCGPLNGVTFLNGKGVGLFTGNGWVAGGTSGPGNIGTPLTTFKTPTCPAGDGTLTGGTGAGCSALTWETTNSLCMSGTIPALTACPTNCAAPGEVGDDYSEDWGAAVGVNVSTVANTAMGQAFNTLTVNFTGTPGGVVKLSVIDSSGMWYCFYNYVSGTPVTPSQLTQSCWLTSSPGPALSSLATITSVGLEIDSSQSAETFTDFCMDSIAFK